MSEQSDDAAADPPTFNTDDLVQLKSGGVVMTFRGYTADGQAHVFYSIPSEGVKQSVLPAEMLRAAVTDSPASSVTPN